MQNYAPKTCAHSNPQNLKYVSLRGKRNSAEVITLRILKLGDYSEISVGPYGITRVLICERERQESRS